MSERLKPCDIVQFGKDGKIAMVVDIKRKYHYDEIVVICENKKYNLISDGGINNIVLVWRSN